MFYVRSEHLPLSDTLEDGHTAHVLAKLALIHVIIPLYTSALQNIVHLVQATGVLSAFGSFRLSYLILLPLCA